MRKEVEEFRRWLTNEERSPSTIRSYCHSVGLFFREYGELTKENVIAFKRKQVELYAPKTATNRVTALNCYCSFAGRYECRVKVVRIQKAHTIENVITIDQLEQLTQGLYEDGNIRGYWMVQFLAKTGVRISEFVRMDKDGLKTGTCEMWTKGKIRRIRIPDMLIRESRQYFETVPGTLLFPNRYGSQMTTRGAAADLARWAVKYGIPREVAHPHSFRHLFAIEFLKRNHDITLLSDLLGHDDINTTAGYLRLSEDQQREEFNRAMEWQKEHIPDIRISRKAD